MDYTIWIGLIVGLLMVGLAPDPGWWLLLSLGIGANGVAVSANGWKMPVRGGNLEKDMRHCNMTQATRYKWLGDIIPTGFGKASLGDFLICAGFMGAWVDRASWTYAATILLLAFTWWASGWAKGFRLFDDEKWPKEIRREAKKNAPIVLVLMLLGNLFHMPGCSARAITDSMRAPLGGSHGAESPSAAKAETQPKWRDMGKLLMPSSEFLTRLRLEESDRAAKGAAAQKIKAALDAKIQKQMDAIQKDPVTHVQERRLRDLQKAATSFSVVSQTSGAFLYTTSDGAVMRWTMASGDEVLAPAPPQAATPQWITSGGSTIVTFSSGTTTFINASSYQQIGTRKGPFCRVTCEFHHRDSGGAGTGDVEVDADYCKTGRIDPSVSEVPGWIAIDAQYEAKTPWSGPALGGLDSYKLYWK